MDSDDSHGSFSDDGNSLQGGTAEIYTSRRNRGCKSRLQNLKSQTNSKLLHLGKTLLAYNTHESHKYAIEIASIFLSGIPPDSYMPEDLFTYLVSIFHIHFNEECTEKIFKNFLSVTATTTPHLRPIVLEHSVRFLAVTEDASAIAEEVTRRCNEWNLELHEVAKHYKWAVKHMETLTSFNSSKVSSNFITELEEVLNTYLEYRRLPNKNLINLYTHLRKAKSLDLINKFIQAFPTIYFLRFNRLKITLSNPQDHDANLIEEDLTKFVRLSGYSSFSIEFLNCFKNFVSSDKLTQILLDLVVAVPHLKRNWELLYSNLSEIDGISSNTLTSLQRPEFLNLFGVYGNISSKFPKDCIDLFLKVASLFLSSDQFETLQLQVTL